MVMNLVQFRHCISGDEHLRGFLVKRAPGFLKNNTRPDTRTRSPKCFSRACWAASGKTPKVHVLRKCEHMDSMKTRGVWCV